jgi:hypothetical protein
LCRERRLSIDKRSGSEPSSGDRELRFRLTELTEVLCRVRSDGVEV